MSFWESGSGCPVFYRAQVSDLAVGKAPVFSCEAKRTAFLQWILSNQRDLLACMLPVVGMKHKTKDGSLWSHALRYWMGLQGFQVYRL